MNTTRLKRRAPLWLVTLATLAAGWLTGRAGSVDRVGIALAQAAGSQVVVTYGAGWNLLAVPTSTNVAEARATTYALGPADAQYVTHAADEATGGRAYWAFFPQAANVTLGKSPAEFTRVLAPANTLVLVGNPSATTTLALGGADEAYAYDPAKGYLKVTQLAPGQGAFVLSRQGGAVTLGKAPVGAEADAIRSLQSAVTATPLDRSLWDQFAKVEESLLRGGHYEQAQSAMDDLRAAAEDGLHAAGSGPVPPPTSVQAESFAAVRSYLADAAAASATGDKGAAEASLQRAGAAANAAEDDAIAFAKGTSDAGQVAYAGATAVQQSGLTPLAATGALLRTAALAAGLGMPTRDEIWTLIDAVLAGTLAPRGAPPAAGPDGPPPAPPAIASAAAVPAAGLCDVPAGALLPDGPALDLLARVNAYRAAHGSPPLQLSASLQRAAAWKAIDMVTRRYYEHDDGYRTVFDRLADCGYTVAHPQTGENITYGLRDPGATVTLWQGDPIHDGNLLNPLFVAVGVKGAAALAPGDPWSWVWVMDFGSELDQPLSPSTAGPASRTSGAFP